MTDADPIPGNWYQQPDTAEYFTVIAVDDVNALIEVQYFDGAIEELDFDTWYNQEIQMAEQPQDWTGPLDDLEPEDLGVHDRLELAQEGWFQTNEEATENLSAQASLQYQAS